MSAMSLPTVRVSSISWVRISFAWVFFRILMLDEEDKEEGRRVEEDRVKDLSFEFELWREVTVKCRALILEQRNRLRVIIWRSTSRI